MNDNTLDDLRQAVTNLIDECQNIVDLYNNAAAAIATPGFSRIEWPDFPTAVSAGNAARLATDGLRLAMTAMTKDAIMRYRLRVSAERDANLLARHALKLYALLALQDGIPHKMQEPVERIYSLIIEVAGRDSYSDEFPDVLYEEEIPF